MKRSALFASALLALGVHAPAHGNELAKLTASDAEASDSFGFFVAISGDTAISGAFGESDGGHFAGAAYIYQRDWGGAGQWGQVTKVVSSDPTPGEYMGHASIDGDIAFVGAYGDDHAGLDSGSVYVYMRDWGGANNWGQVKKVVAPDAAEFDSFGHDVSIDGDTAVAGASGNDDDGNNSGAAYIYRRDVGGPDNWGQVAKITASDAAMGDLFGRVAIFGDTVIVGAYGNADAGAGSGSAYIFERNEGGAENWGEVTKLTASDAAAGDSFGNSVSISGDTAVIGAPYDDDAGALSGSVYVFYRNQGGPNNWGEVTKLTAADAAEGDSLGQDVWIDGDTIVAGAPNDDDAGESTGSVYVFQRNAGGADNWGQVLKLNASDGAEFDQLGRGVSVSGDLIISGAPYDDDAGNSSGSAYVFEVGPDCNGNGVLDSCDIADGTSLDTNGNGIPDDCECPADLNDSGAVDFPDLLAILAAWGSVGGPADLNGGGTVGFEDLLILLAAWGPCLP